MSGRVNVSTSGGRVVREFAFHEPIAWEYWLRKALERGEDGLPILVVLHDAGDNPETFQAAWPFRRVWDRIDPASAQVDLVDGKPVHLRDVSNQFFVLFLYGYSPADRRAVDPSELQGYQRPPGGLIPVDPRSYTDPAELEAVNEVNEAITWVGTVLEGAEQLSSEVAELASGLRSLRKGVWNPGPFVRNDAPQADVEFVRAALDAVEGWLADRMGTITVEDRTVSRPLNPERYYLMGVGEGAMMGYRLIKAMPGKWAAFHAMGGAIGGSLFFDERGGPDTVHDNTPDPNDPAAKPVSLYIHHGGQQNVQGSLAPEEWYEHNDLTVPPGPPGAQAVPRRWGQTDVDELVEGAVMQRGPAEGFVPGYDPLESSVRAFCALNGCTRSSAVSGLHDRTSEPANVSRTATMTIYSRAVPPTDPTEWDNPVVVEHRDGRMNHTNFLGSPNQYITVETIWDWLRGHEQRP